MDLFVGSDLEVVLYLNEGFDFGFLTSEFGVRVSLDNNEIVTNTYNPDKVVKFESELIFSSTKSNIKRMKIHKVPLRLDFCKVENSKLQKPFGYIILNLSGAQYLPKGGNLIIKEDMHKVCGLGKESRGYSPQVLLGLRIQDIPDEVEPNVVEKKQNAAPKMSKHVESPKKQDPQPDFELLPLHCYEIELDFKRLTWLTAMKDIHFRVHHGKGEVTWSAHEEIRETIPGETTVLESLSAKVTFLAVPNDLGNFLKSFQPQITICTLRNGRPAVLGRASLKIPVDNPDTEQSVKLKNLLTLEDMGTFTYQPFLICKGPQIIRELTNADNDEVITDRLKSELEAWKEKERERLQQEFDERLKTEINRLDSERTEKQKQLEITLAEKIKVCRELSDHLTKTINMVKDKEIFMEKTKEEMEAGFQFLNAESSRQIDAMRDDMLNRMKEKDEIIIGLQDELSNLKVKSRSRNYDFTLEQIEALVTELKKLHEQLESANKSKSFFKSQWTRLVRELHRLKSEGDDSNIQVRLKLKNKELQQLGLDHLIGNKRSEGDN